MATALTLAEIMTRRCWCCGARRPAATDRGQMALYCEACQDGWAFTIHRWTLREEAAWLQALAIDTADAVMRRRAVCFCGQEPAPIPALWAQLRDVALPNGILARYFETEDGDNDA